MPANINIHTPKHLDLFVLAAQDRPNFQNSPNPQFPRYLIWFWLRTTAIITSPISIESPLQPYIPVFGRNSVCCQLEQNMGYMRYNRVSSGKISRCRGFRLSPRKLYVLRLRKRFNFFLRLFDSWKLSYGEAVQLLKKVVGIKSGFRRNSSRSLVREEKIEGQDDCRIRSCGRSNSFYAEAIADCLEFIKRTSISSMDQSQDPVNHIQDKRKS